MRKTYNGYLIPEPSKANGNYAPFLMSDNLIFISGQLPIRDGKLVNAESADEEFMQVASKQMEVATLNLISQALSAVNYDINKIQLCVKLNVYIATPDDFKDHALISNIASNIINEVFNTSQNHTRTTIGLKSLPLGSLVEADAIFKIY